MLPPPDFESVVCDGITLIGDVRFGTLRTIRPRQPCPLLDQSGQSQILPRDGLSARTHRDDALSNDAETSSQRQFCADCIIATPGYDFREGQVQLPDQFQRLYADCRLCGAGTRQGRGRAH
jgi:hypothetical protein